MLARRLLIAGGGGSFAPPLAAAFSLAQTGFWSDIPEPRAAYYNGRTYLAWIDDTGDVKVAQYVHATATLSAPFTLATGLSSPSGNIHNSVALCVRSSDHKIVAAFLAEGSSAISVRISTNAEDASAWGSAFSATSGSLLCYVSLHQLASGTMFLLTRNASGGVYYLAASSSVDGGATWDASVSNWVAPVTGTGNPGNVAYWKVADDGSKLHIFTTDTDRSDAHPSSLFHMYFDAGTMYKSDGTSLGASYPIAATSGTLVQDASLGPARCSGWAIDGTGKPAALILVYDAATTSNLARVARWTGSVWQVDPVASSDGIIAGNRHVSAAAIDKANPNTVYLSKKVGAHFELWRYTSPDGGATWSGSALTSGSASDNAMPDTPLNAASGLRVVWGLGTYTSDSSFSFTMQGYG